MDSSLVVHGILQVRILKWVTVPISSGSFQPKDQTQVSRIAGRFVTEPPGKPGNGLVQSVQSLSHVQLFATL